MTMNYEKLTLQRFGERLKNNQYKDITAARRAIGKADWDDDARTKAAALANKHFGITKAAAAASKPAVRSARTAPLVAADRSMATRPAKTSMTVRKPSSEERRSVRDGDLTNAEVVEYCDTVNTLAETIRKTAEISISSRVTADDAARLALECMRLIHGRLANIAVQSSTNLSGVVKALGEAVDPQPHLPRRLIHSEETEGPRSAAGGS